MTSKSLHIYNPSHHTKKHLTNDNETNGIFSCECAICKKQTLKSFGAIKELPELQVHNKRKLKRQELHEIKCKIEKDHISAPLIAKYSHSRLKHYQWSEMDLYWLIEHLLSPNPKIRGCHLKFPDSVFLRKGKIVLRVKSDHNNFLTGFKNAKLLKHTEIRSQFPTIVRERRKRNLNLNDTIEDVLEEEVDNTNMSLSIKKLTNDPNKSSINFSKGDIYKEFSLSSGKTLHGHYYRDMAIIVYNPKPTKAKITLENEECLLEKKHIKIMNEYHFLKLLEMRPNDERWKRINFIQTCIKSKVGIGDI